MHVATGYDRWGMTNAVAAGLDLAGEILGDAPRRPPSHFADPRHLADLDQAQTARSLRWLDVSALIAK